MLDRCRHQTLTAEEKGLRTRPGKRVGVNRFVVGIEDGKKLRDVARYYAA
jgi:hypothetical protein